MSSPVNLFELRSQASLMMLILIAKTRCAQVRVVKDATNIDPSPPTRPNLHVPRSQWNSTLGKESAILANRND